MAMAMVISQIFFIFLLLLLAQSWVVEEKEEVYERRIKQYQQQLDILKAEATGLRLEGSDQTLTAGLAGSFLEHGRYLKFYKMENFYVVELTMLDKKIIKLPIYSSLDRLYEGFLRYAIYKKIGKEIKSHQGMHKNFGDIYSLNKDLKNFINANLKKHGKPEIQLNDLIVQRVKNSGVYELDCHASNIEIDSEGLSKTKGLSDILSLLSVHN